MDVLPSPADALVAVLREGRRLVGRAGNDFSHSSWEDAAEALAELDGAIQATEAGRADPRTLAVLFLPTGPMQEVAVSSGWGEAFLDLASQFDTVVGEPAYVGRIPCSRCEESADVIELLGPRPFAELRRTSFTSVLRQPISQATFQRLHPLLDAPDAGGLYAFDPELVPCWCAACRVAYCGTHWRTWDVFDDDGHHDSIRGACPEGHERMLED